MPKRKLPEAQSTWFAAKSRGSVRGYQCRGVEDARGAKGVAVTDSAFERFSAANSPWSECTFIDCTFRVSSFHFARFERCHFIRCRFEDCVLAAARFLGCRFEDCQMVQCDLESARVEIEDPAAIRFQQSHLAAAQFTGHPFFARHFPEYVCDKVDDRGKQATVYKARRTADEMPVVIKAFDKVFPGSDTAARLRLFNREIASLQRVQNPYLPRLLDFQMEEDAPYLVEELVSGQPLSDWMEQGQRFAGPLRRELFVQSLTGLHSLHTAHPGECLLHRDIKPNNLIVDLTESGLAWKFIDFGLSKIIEGASAQASMRAGTPLTMAPEVLEGRGDSTRSELFSLGVTLAWAVRGEHPYGDRQNIRGQLAAIEAGPVLAGVEQPYLDVLHGCLRYREEDRLTPSQALDLLAA